jgi:long-chain acyl-CoA synthetase
MLVEPLFEQAARQPDELAVIDDTGRYTYARLAAMAGGLGALIAGKTNNPRVGLLLPSGAGFVASFYGAVIAGKGVVPLNFLLGEREIAHCIHDSGIDTVVSIPQLAGRLTGTPLNVLDLTQLAPNPGAPSPAPAPIAPPPRPADAEAVLMYTSGTSGLPKGVVLTLGNIQSNVDGAIAHAKLQHGHKFLGMIPLFHVFGMSAMMLAPLQLGATIVYAARFSPVGAVQAIREHGISIVMGVPSMYGAMLRLKEPTRDDFKTVYAMISGGEPLPAALRDAFAARFGVTLYEAYGMTEASLAIAMNTPQAHKPGSVGKPVPRMQVRIVDDDGSPVRTDQQGEILLRGPMVTRGYHNLPEETAAAFTRDGFFRTGDLGRVDPDGFLHITGRKKDLIIVAGEKASPREIEEALMSHPAVAEAAVVGKRDLVRGEVVAAFVIVREGQAVEADELREHCRRAGLAQWKVPREVHVVADLPRTPTGKVLKRALVQ